jgi:hypothetical protein
MEHIKSYVKLHENSTKVLVADIRSQKDVVSVQGVMSTAETTPNNTVAHFPLFERGTWGDDDRFQMTAD